MSERIAVVRVPCMVKRTPGQYMGGGGGGCTLRDA